MIAEYASKVEQRDRVRDAGKLEHSISSLKKRVTKVEDEDDKEAANEHIK